MSYKNFDGSEPAVQLNACQALQSTLAGLRIKTSHRN